MTSPCSKQYPALDLFIVEASYPVTPARLNNNVIQWINSFINKWCGFDNISLSYRSRWACQRTRWSFPRPVSFRSDPHSIERQQTSTDIIDLLTRGLSAGQPHKAVPITAALALAAAACVAGNRVDQAGITIVMQVVIV